MKVGLGIIILIALASLFAPLIAPYDPTAFDLPQRLLTPSFTHFLGTDPMGVDVFSTLLYGGRLSLQIAGMVALISVSLGLILGSIAGYYGGWWDLVLMRMIDGLYAFPGFLLALAIAAFLGPGLDHLIFALCITGWTGYARLVRAEIYSLKTREYIVAAKALGASDTVIVTRHLWPNLMGVLATQTSFGLAATIVSEAGLSFLGLGAPSNVPSWGVLLSTGRKCLIEAPHVSISAAAMIVLVVLAFNLIGDSLS